ncbi:13232_t:CDS:1, partial [Funneliformis caledonium]
KIYCEKKFQNNNEQESSTADSIPSSITNSLLTIPSITFNNLSIPEAEDLLLNPSILNLSLSNSSVTPSSSDISDSISTLL